MPAGRDKGLRAVPDPEYLCKVDAGYFIESKRAGISCSLLRSLFKLLNEKLRFALKKVSVDTKERIFYLLVRSDQREQDTERMSWRTWNVILPSLR